jgi:hypothetical protein
MSRTRRCATWSGTGALLVFVLVASGCSKKLSSGGSAMDVFFYDICKMDRGTSYYYETLKNAHCNTTFCYQYAEDTYLVDKCVNAIIQLGSAQYSRLEGQAQVVLLLSDVLVEDPSSLAKASAATALTNLATRTPAAPATPIPDRGDRLLAIMKELDGLHDENGVRRNDSPGTRQHVSNLVDEMGRLEFRSGDVLTTKNALKFFPTHQFIVRETDPAMRDAFDRAMVRRMQAVTRETLNRAMLDPNHNVRADAVRGLKTLKHAGALDDAIERLDVETQARVRAEIVEYLGAIGGPKAAERLVDLVEDSDGTVRYKARQSLARIAGQDLGSDRKAWETWRLARFPAPAAPATPGPSVAPPPAAPVVAPPPSSAPAAAGPPAPAVPPATKPPADPPR